MRYLHGKIKAFAGERLSIQFSKPTKVMVMRERDFKKYRDNLTFTYFGGFKERSPFEFTIPKAGTWAVVIEKGTYHKPIDITASITKTTAPAEIAPPKKSKKSKKKEDSLEETIEQSPEEVMESDEVSEEDSKSE